MRERCIPYEQQKYESIQQLVDSICIINSCHTPLHTNYSTMTHICKGYPTKEGVVPNYVDYGAWYLNNRIKYYYIHTSPYHVVSHKNGTSLHKCSHSFCLPQNCCLYTKIQGNWHLFVDSDYTVLTSNQAGQWIDA